MIIDNNIIAEFIDNILDGNLLFAMGLSSGFMCEKLFPKFNKEVYDKKSISELYLEIFLYVSYITVSAIIIKKIASNYISPIEYMNSNFNYKVVSGSVILAFSLLFFQSSFKEKIKYLQKRLIH